jgi:hypothetical protein
MAQRPEWVAVQEEVAGAVSRCGPVAIAERLAGDSAGELAAVSAQEPAAVNDPAERGFGCYQPHSPFSE